MKRLISILVTVVMVATLFVPSMAVFAEGADYSDMIPAEKPANIIANPGSVEQFTTMSFALGGNITTKKDERITWTEKARPVHIGPQVIHI